MSTEATDVDRLYLRLKGARERLCEAQTLVGSPLHRTLLQGSIDQIDRVGTFLPQWSKHDLPIVKEPDWRDAENAHWKRHLEERERFWQRVRRMIR